MEVLYTCDDNYVWLMGISMLSLFDNNKCENNIIVYLLGDNISTENKKLVTHLASQYNRECIIIDIPDLKVPDTLCSRRWPKSAFTRLYAGILLPPEVNKILYLDCDTIITAGIEKIWNIEESSYAISGVKDCISKYYRQNIGVNDCAIYINAGVLLMNLNELRKLNISSMIDDFLNQYSSIMHYADQDVLNGMFKGYFGVLPPEYNLMTLICTYKYKEVLNLRHPSNYYTQNEINNALKKPRIIHYTTCMLTVRPWFTNSDHPFAEVFMKYKMMSPWSNRQLSDYNFKTSLQNLVLRVLLKAPSFIKTFFNGVIHAVIFPLFIRIRAGKKLRV
jgi:lipopolysaccharide biosynthesis glycosyltransferase